MTAIRCISQARLSKQFAQTGHVAEITSKATPAEGKQTPPLASWMLHGLQVLEPLSQTRLTALT